MSDLIAWTPKVENNLKKKWDEKRKELLERDAQEGFNDQPSTSDPKPAVAAPRVKLNEKGEIIVDADSLVITEKPDDNIWTTVNEVSASCFSFANYFFLGFDAEKVELDELQEESGYSFD